MVFEQALVKIDKEKEFAALKGLVEKALAPNAMERFLKQLDKHGVRVRQFEEALQRGALDGDHPTGQVLYRALTVSDQAQMREFYLSKIEDVEPKLRTKFRKLYQYY